MRDFNYKEVDWENLDSLRDAVMENRFLEDV